MNNITIIGSGSFGCALAYILSKKENNNIKIWSYTTDEMNIINNEHKCKFLPGLILDNKIKCYNNYELALKNSNYIILAIPSNNFRKICKDIKKYINNQVIIIASKGLEKNKLLSDIVKEELNKKSNIISGPSHAEQIIKDIPTFVEYNGSTEIKKLFENDNFKLSYNNDIIGIELGASLKNIIALVVGILDGLKYESNTISYAITEGLREIKEIGITMGAKEDTFYGLSGLGDLLTTTISNDSRNKRAGILLSKGKSIKEIKEILGMTIEGLDALNSAKYIIDEKNINCPLIINLYEIIYNNKDIKSII